MPSAINSPNEDSRAYDDCHYNHSYGDSENKLVGPEHDGYRRDKADLSDLSTSLNIEARSASTTSFKSACAKFHLVGSLCSSGT